MAAGLSPTRTSTPVIDNLRALLAQGVTGCVTLHRPGRDELRLYITQGEILAAQSAEDGSWLVRRLVNANALTERQGASFARTMERGHPYEDLLQGAVPEGVYLAALEGRFRQNILEFISGTGTLDFEATEGIFVPNVQTAHDTTTLLGRLIRRWDRIAPLLHRREPMTLRPGPGMPATQEAARLLDLCDPAATLEDLLLFSPFEEGDTLDFLLEMVESGQLVCDEGLRFTSVRRPPAIEEGYEVEELFSPDPEDSPRIPPVLPASFLSALTEPTEVADGQDWGDEAPVHLDDYEEQSPTVTVEEYDSIQPLPADTIDDLQDSPSLYISANQNLRQLAGLDIIGAEALTPLPSSLPTTNSRPGRSFPPSEIRAPRPPDPEEPAAEFLDIEEEPILLEPESLEIIPLEPVAPPAGSTTRAPGRAEPADHSMWAPEIPADLRIEHDSADAGSTYADPKSDEWSGENESYSLETEDYGDELEAELESALAEAVSAAEDPPQPDQSLLVRRFFDPSPAEDVGDPFFDIGADEDQGGPPAPAAHRAFFADAAGPVEQELAFFVDQDEIRGRGEGQFSLDRQHLDEVDLRDELPPIPPPADTEELIETMEADAQAQAQAVQLLFGPPPLREEEAAHRLGVANEVLFAVANHLDASQGPGTGAAAVQSVLDGTAGLGRTIFHQIEVDEQGRFPLRPVITNLHRLPDPQRRSALDAALLDVIERALSYACELLPESELDALLQEIAGYQRRLSS